jgi:hypothetical protein
MSSGTEIIQNALQHLGVHSVIAPAGAESISIGKDTLNSMLASWLAVGLDLGCNELAKPGDELAEPLSAKNCIEQNLAIMMAPYFKKEVGRTLYSNAAKTLKEVKKQYQSITVPKKKVSSTMPLGAGNRRGYFHRNFAGNDNELD